MSVPRLTIPESAFDPSSYNLHSRRRSKTGTLLFLLQLTRGSTIGIIVAYILGIFVLRPLMATATLQRLEFLEECRAKLRDLYLNTISRVRVIPIVGFDKTKGSGKVYVDAICQTDDLSADSEATDPTDSLGQNAVLDKLNVLNDGLKRISAYLSRNVPHYNVVNFTIKDLRQKTDLVYFNQRELFSSSATANRKTANVAQDVKTNIRSIKGMFMSGKA